MSRDADGGEQCLVDIPRWDFEWQMGYRYKESLFLEPGSFIRTTCEYDNPGSQTVTFGPRTRDEMCFQFLFVVDNGALPEKCFAPCIFNSCD